MDKYKYPGGLLPAGRRSELFHFAFFTVTLFLFWLLLTGRFELKYLAIGLGSAIAVAIITRPLMLLPWGSEKGYLRPAWDLPWLKLLAYLPWLFWQLVLANLQVAWLVLQPRLPINPQVVRFTKSMPSPVAHVILANSITLTPGTVTIDLEGSEYTIHALSREAARSLVPRRGEGEMQRRVGAVFSENEGA